MISRLREALTTSSAFSIAGWGLLIPWSYLVTWTLRPTLQPSTLFLLTVPLIAHVLGGLVILFGYRIHRATAWRLGSGFTIVIFVLYGIVRTTTVNGLLRVDKPDHVISMSLVTTATIVAVVWQILAAVMIHYSRINLEIIAELQNRKNQLELDIETLSQQLLHLRVELPKQIQTKVKDVLQHLAVKTQPAELMADTLLSNLLDEYVRPLSRELREAQTRQRPNPSPLIPITTWKSFQLFVSDIATKNSFAPNTVSAIVTATGLPTILIFVGIEKLWISLVFITLGVWAVVHLTAILYAQIQRFLQLPLQLLLLLFLWVVPGFTVGIALRTDPDTAGYFVNLNIAGPSLTLVASMVSAVYFAGISRRENLIQSLDLETANKNFQKQALRQEVKIAENQLIHLLHGKLQGQLNVLRNQIDAGNYPETDLTRQEIAASLEDISTTSEFKSDFQSSLKTILNLWRRVAKVEIEISPEMTDNLQRRKFVGFAVVEIVREVINNSIKHGGAHEIKIRIFQTTPQKLGIEISNDGKLLPSKSRSGLGTQLLNDYCMNWELIEASNKVIFTAEVVCP